MSSGDTSRNLCNQLEQGMNDPDAMHACIEVWIILVLSFILPIVFQVTHAV